MAQFKPYFKVKKISIDNLELVEQHLHQRSIGYEPLEMKEYVDVALGRQNKTGLEQLWEKIPLFKQPASKQ